MANLCIEAIDLKLWDGKRRPEEVQNKEVRSRTICEWGDDVHNHIFKYFDNVYKERYHVNAPDEYEMRVRPSDLVDLVFTMMDAWKEDFTATINTTRKLPNDDHHRLFDYHSNMMSKDIHNIKAIKEAVDNKQPLAVLKVD
jgi:hypothetical protein